MKAIANGIKLQFNESGAPELVLSLVSSRHEIIPEVQECKDILAKGKLLSIEIKQHRKARSLDSNAYCWQLCQKIAEVIRNTKEEVYKRAIREVGQFETLAVQEEAAEQFVKVWNSRGLGWYAEEMDSKLSGCKKIIAYYGSSCYDSRAMSVLINYIVDECKTLDIETMTPMEISRMNQEWGK